MLPITCNCIHVIELPGLVPVPDARPSCLADCSDEVPISITSAAPIAPALVAILVALRVFRTDRAVARLVAGSAAVALALSVAGVRDGAPHLSVLVASAVAFIALIVSGFAARSMHGGSVPYATFLALLAGATAGALTIAVAADLRVLAAAWIATGLFASGLLGAARGKNAARRWALRHLAIERIGDLAWIIVLITTWRSYHTFDLQTLARIAAPSHATTAIAVALVIAGMTRSALVPFHAWLPNSMEAPTTVSAFMHAGIVNGAGVLLAKTAALIVVAPAALTIDRQRPNGSDRRHDRAGATGDEATAGLVDRRADGLYGSPMRLRRVCGSRRPSRRARRI